MKSKSILRLAAALGFACAGSASAADISFSSSTPLTFTDTQSYDNGTVDRIGGGTGTLVIFDSPANYTFSGNLTLTGAWNRVTLNSGASLNVAGTLGVDVSGVSLNGGTLTAGALLLGDNPNWAGTLNDGKQTIEWGDSVINGSTIVANQSNATFISMGTNSGFSVNWLWINGDGATIDSNGFDIGNTMNTWGGGGLTKTGAGTLSLTASNNFTGNTLVSNGVLEVTTSGKLYGGGYTASPSITVGSGGTLRINGWSWDAAGSIANLDYGRNRLVVNGGTIEYTGASNFNPGDPGSASRNLTVGTGGATLKASSAAGQTWTISSGNGNIINNESLTLDGNGAGAIQKVIEGTGSVTKTGSGTWTLSGANTYSGSTTVTAGVLSVGNGTNSSNLNDSAAVTVGQAPASGAKIDLNFIGTDIVGSLTLDGSDAGTGLFSATSHPAYFSGGGQLFVSSGPISDNDGTWASSTDGYWEIAGNWASNTIASGIDKTATFNGALGTTVSLLTGITIGNLDFSVEDYTIAGAALTLDASVTPAISVASGRTATISAELAGGGGMEKNGAGTLVLTGVKSYIGGTTVTGGTLEINNATTYDLSAVNGSLTVASGATLKISGLDYTGLGRLGARVTSLDVDGGTVENTIQSWLAGTSVNLTGGTMNGTGTYHIISSGLSSFESATTATISNNLVVRKDYGSADLSFDVADGTAATDLLISGNIDQFGAASAAVNKLGSGKMEISGTNTYTGNTVVYDGAFEVSSGARLRFRPTTNGNTNSVLGTSTATMNYLGTVDLDLAAADATGGNVWNLIDLASFSGPAPTLTPAAVTSTLGAFSEVSPGTWELPVTGAKWVFTTADGNLAYVVTVSDYDTWKTANGVTGGVNDDDDNDGLTNIEEYSFGLDPTGPASLTPIAVPLDKAAGTFSYTRRTQSLTGLTYTVWYSTSLTGWSQDTGAVEGTPAVTGEVETVPVTLSPSLLTNPTLFIQVRAQ